jgi:hypothetical protein
VEDGPNLVVVHLDVIHAFSHERLVHTQVGALQVREALRKRLGTRRAENVGRQERCARTARALSSISRCRPRLALDGRSGGQARGCLPGWVAVA